MKERASDQKRIRIEKLQQLIEQGVAPFANDFHPENLIKDVLESYGNSSKEQLSQLSEQFVIAGRVLSKRDFGKSIFFDLKDGTGKMQGFIQRDNAGADSLKFFKKYIDVGDFIGVQGILFQTRTGELTLNVSKFRLLTKSLQPLPEKWHGLQDVELRYRQRYIDLISNDHVKEIFVKRSKIISSIRNYLENKGFMEVETPVLHAVAGGATAKPFVTHHNVMDLDLYLRVAPELYLKRLVIGGLERVYEIGRVFRNEGVSTRHNPEFTMIELYQAYEDHEGMMVLIENMINDVCRQVSGGEKITYQDKEIDLKTPWSRVNVYESLAEKYGHEFLKNEKGIFKKAQSLGIEHNDVKGKAIMEIFEQEIGKHLIDPTFVHSFPVEISPLARKNDDDPEVTDRFELYINGWEIANAFSELNDPVDQRKRFEDQLNNKSGVDEEFHEVDEDFIEALEYGMPPTAGAGIGIDRLVMLLTNSSSIREVIFFPHLKP